MLSPHPAFSVLLFTFVLFFFLSRIYILNTCVHWTSLSEAKYLWSSKQSEGLRSAGCAQVGRSSECAQVSRVAGCAQVSVVCPGQHKLWAGQVLGVKAVWTDRSFAQAIVFVKKKCMWICRVCIGVKSWGFSALYSNDDRPLTLPVSHSNGSWFSLAENCRTFAGGDGPVVIHLQGKTVLPC